MKDERETRVERIGKQVIVTVVVVVLLFVVAALGVMIVLGLAVLVHQSVETALPLLGWD